MLQLTTCNTAYIHICAGLPEYVNGKGVPASTGKEKAGMVHSVIADELGVCM